MIDVDAVEEEPRPERRRRRPGGGPPRKRKQREWPLPVAAAERHPPRDPAAAGSRRSSLRGATKTYGSGEIAVHALRGVDLEIWPEEFVVLLGPSGSGKTTLLNLVGGIEPPSGGEIEVSGQDVTALDEEGRTRFRRETVGFIFQFFNLIPTLTALENVAAGRRARERRGPLGGDAGAGRARRPARPLPGPALRRRAAAGRGRAGARRPAPGSCSATSRPARSTSRPAAPCSGCCTSSATRCTRRCCWSPTTRRSPAWPTGCCGCATARIVGDERNPEPLAAESLEW